MKNFDLCIGLFAQRVSLFRFYSAGSLTFAKLYIIIMWGQNTVILPLLLDIYLLQSAIQPVHSRFIHQAAEVEAESDDVFILVVHNQYHTLSL